MLFQRIIMLRKQAYMSQIQLAEILNISASTISMYEQGRRTPGLDVLVKMSQIFHVSLDYLITGNDFVDATAKFNIRQAAENCPCNTCYWKEYKLRDLE